MINLFAELDRPEWGTQLRVLYNVFGERIDVRSSDLAAKRTNVG